MPQKRLYIPQTLKLSYLAHFKSTPESQDQKALLALPVLMAQCLSKTLPRNRRNLYEDHRASKANPCQSGTVRGMRRILLGAVQQQTDIQVQRETGK